MGDDTRHTLGNRRDLFRTFGIATTAATAGAGLLAACGQSAGTGGAPSAAGTSGAATGAQPGGTPETKTLRIGYLPITDATPLLLAHAQGLYAAEGLAPEKPTLFRSW